MDNGHTQVTALEFIIVTGILLNIDIFIKSNIILYAQRNPLTLKSKKKYKKDHAVTIRKKGIDTKLVLSSVYLIWLKIIYLMLLTRNPTNRFDFQLRNYATLYFK